eukprot:2591443-Rhodomonas_salina.2
MSCIGTRGIADIAARFSLVLQLAFEECSVLGCGSSDGPRGGRNNAVELLHRTMSWYLGITYPATNMLN